MLQEAISLVKGSLKRCCVASCKKLPRVTWPLIHATRISYPHGSWESMDKTRLVSSLHVAPKGFTSYKARYWERVRVTEETNLFHLHCLESN